LKKILSSVFGDASALKCVLYKTRHFSNWSNGVV